MLPPRGPTSEGSAHAVVNDPALLGASETPLIPHAAGGALAFAGGATVGIGGLPLDTDFTLEAWVRPAAPTRATVILSKEDGDADPDGIRLGALESGAVYFTARGAGSTDSFRSLTPLPVATWSHVAVTRTGSVLVLLVDGVRNGPPLTATGAYTGGAHDFKIGARAPGSDDAFVGTIDQVRVWSVARTAEQIVADMRRTITARHPDYTSLLGAWRFDEMTGASVSDDTGARTGTILGATWVPSTAF